MFKRILLILCMLTLLSGSALADGPHRLRAGGWPVDLYEEGTQVRIIVGGETWIYSREAGGGGQVAGPEGGLYFDKAMDALAQWEELQGRAAPEPEASASSGFVPGVLLVLGGGFCLASPQAAWQLVAGGKARKVEPSGALLARYRSVGGLALIAGLALLFLV